MSSLPTLVSSPPSKCSAVRYVNAGKDSRRGGRHTLQIFDSPKFLVEVREELPVFVPIVIDLRPRTPNNVRVRSGHFRQDDMLIFQQDKTKK